MAISIRIMFHTKFSSLLAVTLVPVFLAGCGNQSDHKDKDTQVAAKVNGDEITVHQINQVLSHAPNLKPEQAKQAAADVLHGLVDQQLLIEQAKKDKLDRNPQVVAAYESAHAQILTQAYLDQELSKLPQPTDHEIKDYYTQHPELFANRRLYRFQELTIDGSGGRVPEIRKEIGLTKQIDAFVEWLKAEKIPFNINNGIKKAEEVPLNLLPRLSKMQDGQAMVTVNGSSVLIVQLVASQQQPMAIEAAKPVIAAYLANSKRRDATTAMLKKLHDKAKIEYVGTFAYVGKSAVAKPVAAPSTVPAPIAGAVKNTPAKPAAAASDAMEKGLSGLK
ncbi:MAG: EpsD family peptidyl-prolyl cis-trans isomerase [Sulfuriferula sp.]